MKRFFHATLIALIALPLFAASEITLSLTLTDSPLVPRWNTRLTYENAFSHGLGNVHVLGSYESGADFFAPRFSFGIVNDFGLLKMLNAPLPFDVSVSLGVASGRYHVGESVNAGVGIYYRPFVAIPTDTHDEEGEEEVVTFDDEFAEEEIIVDDDEFAEEEVVVDEGTFFEVKRDGESNGTDESMREEESPLTPGETPDSTDETAKRKKEPSVRLKDLSFHAFYQFRESAQFTNTAKAGFNFILDGALEFKVSILLFEYRHRSDLLLHDSRTAFHMENALFYDLNSITKANPLLISFSDETFLLGVSTHLDYNTYGITNNTPALAFDMVLVYRY